MNAKSKDSENTMAQHVAFILKELTDVRYLKINAAAPTKSAESVLMVQERDRETRRKAMIKVNKVKHAKYPHNSLYNK